MFKRFNMFALALLVLGQTILGPIGISTVAFADELDEPEATPETTSEETVEEVDKTKLQELLAASYDSEKYDESSYASYVDAINKATIVYQSEYSTQEDVNKAVDEIQQAVAALQEKIPEEDEGDDADRELAEVEDDATDGEDGDSEGEPADEQEEGTEEETEENPENDDLTEEENAALQAATEAVEAAEAAGEDLTEELYDNAVALVEALDDIEVFNDSSEKAGLQERIGDLKLLTVMAEGSDVSAEMNITNIRISEESDNGNGEFPLDITKEELSETYTLKFDFSLDEGHNVQPGDYYEFTVPTAFDLSPKEDEALGTDGLATYSVHTDGTIRITFTELIRNGDKGVPISDGKFDAGWALAENAKQGDLVQEYPFDISGDKTFILSVENPGGKAIAKSSKGVVGAINDKNPTSIKWQVDINTNTTDISDLELTDSLTVKPGTITVIELEPQITGDPKEGSDTGGWSYKNNDNNFPITFDNSKKAYRITYETEITDEQREDAITGNPVIQNKASLGDDSATSIEVVSFDAPISKSAGDYEQSNGAAGEIEWTIEVNADGRDISGGVTVKDTLSLSSGSTSGDEELMKIDSGSIEIEPEPANVTTRDINDRDFTLSFEPKSENANKVHTITYKTKDSVVDLDYSVSNKAELSYVGTEAEYETEQKRVEVKQNVLEKSNISATSNEIDYGNKTIDWTINFNQSNYSGITDVVFEDTFQDGKYMKLYESDFNVPSGFHLELKNPQTDSDGKYTLKGFTLTAETGTTVSDPVTINYTTHFDPKDPTTGTSINNTVGVVWHKDGEEYTNNDTGTVNLNSHTGKNGAKSGEYNPEHKTLAWELDVNYNLHDLVSPVIEDTFGEKQTMTQEQLDSIKVYTLNMTANPTIKDEVSKDDYSVVGTGETPDGFTGFKLSFDEDTSEAYRVVYETGYVNKFIGELDGNSGNQAKNTAILKSNGETHTTYDTPGPNIPNAGEYFTKNGRDIPNVDYLEWTFAFNKSQSHIQEDSTIEDKLNDGQVLVTDFDGLSLNGITDDRNTFEVKKRVYTGTSSTQETLSESEVDELFDIVVAPDQKSFTITLKEDINHEYEISYVTDISASNLTTLSNKYTYNFNGKTKEGTETKEVTNVTYEYTGGDANLPRYDLKLSKVDGVTGDSLENVKFGLYLGDTLVVDGVTNTEGELAFDGIKYGTYTLKELEPSTNEYSTEFQVDGENTYSSEYKFTTSGKTKELDIKMINKKICPEFTLTVKYENEPVDEGVDVIIKDETGTSEVTTGKTNSDGQIKFEESELPKGQYKVYDKLDNELGDINVLYLEGDCEAEVTWEAGMDVSCPTFTLTVKENDTPVGKNMKITLEKEDDPSKSVTAYTNKDGKIAYDKEKVDLPSGTYKVLDYKGDDTGKTVEVETMLVCKDEINLDSIQSCPVFTLTVNDHGNNPEKNTEIVVKDKDGNKVEGFGADEEGRYTTNNDGQIELPYVIENGTYTVYKVNENGTETRINTFKVTDDSDCKAEVKPRPIVPPVTPPDESCDVFTITVQQDDVVVDAGVEIAIEDNEGEIATGTTNADGQIEFDDADLPEGSYTVVDKDGNDLGDITVSYEKGECQATVNITTPPAESCEFFTITVKEDGEPVGKDVEIIVQDENGEDIAGGKTDENGQVKTDEDTLPEGDYTIFDEDGEKLGTITVSYDGNCEDEVNIGTPVESCDFFTVTVKEDGKPVGEDVEVSIQDEDGNEVTTGKTNEAGKIEFNESDLPEGEYTVVDKNGDKVGTITVSYNGNCEDEVDLSPSTTPPGPGGESCDFFTVTVKEDGEPVSADVEITIEDEDGKEVTTGITNKDGQVEFDERDLPEGDYTVVDKDGKKLGTITVSYDGTCEDEVNSTTPTPPGGKCEVFTLTVERSNGTPQKEVEIYVRDAEGNLIEDENGDTLFTTDENGQVFFDNVFEAGHYRVYTKHGKLINSFTADTELCEETVRQRSSGGGGGGGTPPDPDPEDPNEPGEPGEPDPEDPNEPGDPGNPDPEDPNEPGEPGDPDPEDPNEPGKPGDPDPEDPNEPGKPGDPDPEDPNEPGKPGDPDPEDPNEPGKPGEPDPEDPNEPGKPGDPDPEDPNEPGDPGQSGDSSQTPGDGKPGTDSNSNVPGGDKLPQTGEELYVYMIALGTVLLAAGGFVLFRRRSVR